MSETGSYCQLIDAVRNDPPQVALVLGSGLGQVAARMERLHCVPFGEVPGLQATSVAGHAGRLSLGDWAGRRVLVFEGRLHFYETGDWRGSVASVHAAKSLGAGAMLLTNAAGGIRDDLRTGTLMVIRDHIEWARPYCWRHDLATPRPSLYSARLRSLLFEASRKQDIALREGVYAAVTGPCYETPAEIRALRGWGADAVGMSTAREIRTASDLGLECAALSLITNRAAGLADGPIHHREVLNAAQAAAERLTQLIEGFLLLL